MYYVAKKYKYVSSAQQKTGVTLTSMTLKTYVYKMLSKQYGNLVTGSHITLTLK